MGAPPQHRAVCVSKIELAPSLMRARVNLCWAIKVREHDRAGLGWPTGRRPGARTHADSAPDEQKIAENARMPSYSYYRCRHCGSRR